jgi:hypothetical protein
VLVVSPPENKKSTGAANRKLAILVSSDTHADHVLNLTTAAFVKGIRVEIFFTGKGVRLTMDPRISQLIGKARVSICRTSFKKYAPPGRLHGRFWEAADFACRTEAARMLATADRYVVL